MGFYNSSVIFEYKCPDDLNDSYQWRLWTMERRHTEVIMDVKIYKLYVLTGVLVTTIDKVYHFWFDCCIYGLLSCNDNVNRFYGNNIFCNLNSLVYRFLKFYNLPAKRFGGHTADWYSRLACMSSYKYHTSAYHLPEHWDPSIHAVQMSLYISVVL